MPDHTSRPSRPSLSNIVGSQGGVVVAPADGIDPRYVVPRDDDNWMSKAVADRQVANLEIVFKGFIDSWLLNGYSLEQLKKAVDAHEASVRDGKT